MSAPTQKPPEGHVILCGLGQVGWLVFDYLKQIGWPLVAVDSKCDPADPRLGGTPLVRGDCRLKATLEAAGLAQAKALLALTAEDLVNLTAALTARSVRPDLRIVARFFNQNIINRLGKAVPNLHAVSKSALTAPLFALTALSGETLGAFALPHGQKEIVELRLGPLNPLLGQKLGPLAHRHQVALLAHERASAEAAARACLLHEVDAEATLAEGDRLVVCGGSAAVSKLSALAQDEEADGLKWANFFWRQGRVLARTFAEIETPVKAVIGVFAVVMLISALVFYALSRHGEHTLVEGMYRTISVMATAADLKGEKEDESLKLFIVFLRIVGIVLTAALTALLTNYLVRAKLGGAFAAGRIPDSGHIVVCGLGAIGFRVVEELRRHEVAVVVIERDAANRFAAPARRLKAMVLIGDASQKEVLAKAHSAQAKAVIAATSDDLANVEISLLARDLNPKQRVVLRLDDPLLATALKATAPIRHALAVPALAAPAIVAALYQDRVLSLFTCQGKLMVAVEVSLEGESAPNWLGQVVRAAAVDFGFVPVDLVADGKPVPMTELPNHRLASGDRLTVVVALADLDRFVRHEAPPANWAVEVESYPLPMKDWLAQLFRSLNGTDAAAALAALEQSPLRLKAGLTRGQAEELLGQLRRERILGTALAM